MKIREVSKSTFYVNNINSTLGDEASILLTTKSTYISLDILLSIQNFLLEPDFLEHVNMMNILCTHYRLKFVQRKRISTLQDGTIRIQQRLRQWWWSILQSRNQTNYKLKLNILQKIFGKSFIGEKVNLAYVELGGGFSKSLL